MHRNGQTTSLELDSVTARLLLRLAETWGVSEEEAIRRAVKQANAETAVSNNESRLAAFKALQRNLGLSPVKASEWQAAVREARR